MSSLAEVIQLQREALALCPVGHPDRYLFCRNLAVSLTTEYESTGDDCMFDEVIDLEREALYLCPEGHPDRSMSCANLAISLKTRYKLTGDDLLLDEAINLEREAHALHPKGHPYRSMSCRNLAISLSIHCERMGDDRLWDEIIDLEREALALRPAGHPDRYICCKNLTISLSTQYEITGDYRLLDEIIDLEREALALRPAGHPDRYLCCKNLAISLSTRYKITGDERLLDETIDLEREALALRPEGHPDRSMPCANLAISLKARYDRTGDIGLLDEAIDLEHEALILHPEGHPDRSMTCGNLGFSLKARYERTGDTQCLDEAVDLEREALALRPKGHPYRSMAYGNLAASLIARFERTGDKRLFDEAIDLQREALALNPEGHPDRPAYLGNLALSLTTQYARTGEIKLLDEAIDLQREALALRPEGRPDRYMFCGNLAISLRTRYERKGDDRLLDEAIDLEREALALCHKGDPHRSERCGNLAVALETRYMSTGDTELLDEIMPLLQEAQVIAPALKRSRILSQLSWLHLQSSGSFYDVSKSITYLSQTLESELEDIRTAVRIVFARLDIIWDHNIEDKHGELTKVYQQSVSLLPLLANYALDARLQLEALKNCNRIGSDSFVNALMAGNLALGLETLEVAQGVIWSQSLHRRDPQLEEVPNPQASDFKQLTQALAKKSTVESYRGEASARTPHDALHANSSRLYALVREIRTLPGLDRFMLGEAFDVLRTVAINHPVVVLVGARNHNYALIMASSFAQGYALLPLDIAVESLENLTTTPNWSRSHRGSDAPGNLSPLLERLSMGKNAPTRHQPMSRYLKAVWKMIVKPVLDCLGIKALRDQDRPRLHWCPTGRFSSVPLHAAGIYDGTHQVSCADYVVSSYTPTVTALLRAQRAATPLRRDHLSLALVAEKRAQDTTLLTIPGVDEEIEHIAAAMDLSTVNAVHQQAGMTTVTGTSAMMQTANIVHLACHGIQDIGDATQSGFCLGDGRLTIAKLMELKLDDAFLAFLSACETAKGDKEQPDQAIHLAAAMLFSGFKSVIATMWAIRDDDGPRVAKWFYEKLLSSEVIDADSVAYALDCAVGKLRNSNVSPDRWAPFIHMGV